MHYIWQFTKNTLRTLAIVVITMQLMAVAWHKADQNASQGTVAMPTVKFDQFTSKGSK